MYNFKKIIGLKTNVFSGLWPDPFCVTIVFCIFFSGRTFSCTSFTDIDLCPLSLVNESLSLSSISYYLGVLHA